MQDIDSYIAGFPEEIRENLETIRMMFKEIAPLGEEKMIYGVPGFKYKGKTLLVYAAFKEHIGLYPEPEAIEVFKEELAPYKTAKGTIQFRHDTTLPFDLIRKIITWKVDFLS